MPTTAELHIKLIGQDMVSRMFRDATASARGLNAALAAPAKGLAALSPAALGAPVKAVGGLVKGLGAIGLAGLGLQTVTDSAKGLADILGVGLNAELETTRATMFAFTKDMGVTDKLLADLRAEADRTPFSFKELAGAAASLIPASKAANAPLKSLISTAEILSALNPAEGLEGAAFSLREALSGDFVSIVERFNLPRQRLNDLKREGVPAIEAINRVLKEMGVDSSLVAAKATTFTGRLSTLKDTIDGFRLALSRPLFEALKVGLERLQIVLDQNKESITAVATRWGEALGRLALAAIDNLPRAVAALQQFGGFIVGTVIPAAQRLGQFVMSELVPPLQALGAFLIGDVLPKARQFAAWFTGEALPAIQPFAELIGGLVLARLTMLADLVTGTLLPALRGMGGWFQGDGVGALTEFLGLSQALGDLLAAVVGPAFAALQTHAAAIGKEMAPLAAGVKELLVTLQPVAGFIGEVLGAIISLLPGALKSLTGFITQLTGGFQAIGAIFTALRDAVIALAQRDIAGALGAIKKGFEEVAAANAKVAAGGQAIAAGQRQAGADLIGSIFGQPGIPAAAIQGPGVTQRPPAFIGPPAPTADELARQQRRVELEERELAVKERSIALAQRWNRVMQDAPADMQVAFANALAGI
jgi:hypothetical protein